MNKDSKIYIAGHRGLVGSALKRQLEKEGYTNLVFKTREELDLTDNDKTSEFFNTEKPEYVFYAAAKVGGIIANKTYPADFIYQNLQIQNNVIHNSYLNKVKKLLFLGSSCIYPKFAEQPIKEDYFMTGKLEPTNEAYAVAKIAGITMCQAYNTQYGTNYISAMPTNLYGINDNFDPETSHVLPALIRKIHDVKQSGQKEITIWGTGSPLREFLFVDDLAEALIFLMQNYDDSEIINVGSGQEISILDLAKLIAEVIGYEGQIKTDPTKPDGTPRKLIDISKIKSLGWKPKTKLEDGIKITYDWFIKND